MHAPSLRSVRTAFAAIVALALPLVAHADRVVVKGTALEGTVISIGAKAVEFKTIYGDGTLTLKLADVTAIETDGVFHVYHGDAEATGRAIDIALPKSWPVSPQVKGALRAMPGIALVEDL